MRKRTQSDLILFHHSGGAKKVVELAKVDKPDNSDPMAPEEDGSAFDIRAIETIKQIVSLKAVKADLELQNPNLFTNSRLSEIAVEAKDVKRLLDLAPTSV